MTDEFDFYPCLVDGAPASIYVNLRYEHETPSTDDTLYTVAIRMRERGEHGIGTAEESADLALVEDAVIMAATARAITYVGRLRTAGIWEIVLYGPAGLAGPLRTTATNYAGDRRHEVRDLLDASWDYYRELLLPDAERRQWMDDRRMVQILSEQGDNLAIPRRVEHRLFFPTPAARDAFVAATGFTLDSTDDAAEGDLPFRADVYRVDPIDLEHIHEVVMTLVDAALANSGRYDRWLAGIKT